MSAATKTKHEHEEEGAGALTFLATITGRTPAVPENTSEPAEIRMRPMDDQTRVAAGMAQELLTTKTWRDDMGRRAPEAKDVADALLRAKALSDEAARAAAWRAYLKGEAEQAWQHALELTGKLREHFDTADRADPNIALRYANTKDFFSARATVAARAVVTRKKNHRTPKNG